MWLYFFEIILLFMVFYLAFTGVYQLFLAISYFTSKVPVFRKTDKQHKFAVIVPAHNEEMLIREFCENIIKVDYPVDLHQIFIVADNCTDQTVSICLEYPVKVLTRQDSIKKGKGYALEWALEQFDIEKFDAILILDADTTVKLSILKEINKHLNNDEEAIQCYIEVPNKDETLFTQLISLSRTINNRLYHYAKYKLGLSSYLMGTGMCFSTKLLKNIKWNAFTLSEDWEYYAKLIEKSKKISFSVNAVIYQMESSSFKQATSQRLRWASGRFYVLKSLGFMLLAKGIVRKDWVMTDASLALILPNWSLQINMIFITLLALLSLPYSTFKIVTIGVCAGLIIFQSFIVIVGVFLTRSPMTVFKALLIAPFFLIWKLVIDLLCITKIYKGKDWIRTKRHIPKK